MSDESDNDALTAAVKKNFAAAFGAVLKLAPDTGPPLWIDGRENPPKILNSQPDGVEVACLWSGAREALTRATASARAFESAYVSGRVLITGDMSVMSRIALGESR
ncbi:hypothetical protein [Hyphococcus sp.]|uniref:hypothetical protein n=1 Tax=Hyphococcus sp. TaxID=2038636 RepID=UPI002088035B|nr:MAG: hypothetical protein DHS20C04_23140 [Marinicaulis sp.]